MTAPPGGNGQSRSARFRNPRARIRSARMLKFKGDGTRMAGRSRAQRRNDANTQGTVIRPPIFASLRPCVVASQPLSASEYGSPLLQKRPGSLPEIPRPREPAEPAALQRERGVERPSLLGVHHSEALGDRERTVVQDRPEQRLRLGEQPLPRYA